MRKQSPWGLPVSGSHTLIEVSNEPLTTNTPSNCREGWERWSQNQNKELKDAKPPHVELSLKTPALCLPAASTLCWCVPAACAGTPLSRGPTPSPCSRSRPTPRGVRRTERSAPPPSGQSGRAHSGQSTRPTRAAWCPESPTPPWEKERHYIAAVTANQVKVNQRCAFVSLLKLRWPSSMSSCVTLICVCVSAAHTQEWVCYRLPLRCMQRTVDVCP